MLTDPRLGTELAGYRIDSVIGRGGMGVVYLAEHLRLKRKVALKLIAPDLADDPKFRERFLRESELAASLEHPNILPIYDAGEVGGILYIAMRFIDGMELKSLIDRDGPLEPSRAIGIVGQAAAALDAAHERGLIHRDVKSANILLSSPDTPREHAFLTDFGLTKRLSSDSGLTATGQFVGTLDYAAPEQFEGKVLDARTDVYSLGCVLYECLTGEIPFRADTQAALVYAHLLTPPPPATAKRPELSPSLDAVIAKAMAKKPEDRYASAGELAEAARAEVVAPAGPIPSREASRRPAGFVRSVRRRPLIAAAALLGVAAVVVAAALLLGGGQGKSTGVHGQAAPKSPAHAARRIDVARGTVTATVSIGRPLLIPCGSQNVASNCGSSALVQRRMAIGGEGSVWIANEDDNTVTRIDPVSNRATTIHLPHDPLGIAVGQGSVWVSSDLGHAIYRIDPSTNRVAETFPVPALERTGMLAVDPETGLVWFDDIGGPSGPPCFGSELSRLDPSSGEVSLWAGCAGGARGMVVAGGGVWFADDGTLQRVDARTKGVMKTFDLPNRCGCDYPNLSQIAADPSNGYLWVTGLAPGGLAGTLTQFDMATNKVVTQLTVGCCPGSVAVGGGFVWVTDSARGTIDLINATTGDHVKTISVGRGASGIVAASGAAWVTVDA